MEENAEVWTHFSCYVTKANTPVHFFQKLNYHPDVLLIFKLAYVLLHS